KINAQGVLNIDAVQTIDNQSGIMVANQDIGLHSQGLNNSQGQIGSAHGLLNIDLGQKQLLNKSGSLQAATDLNITSGDLNNNSGSIVALSNNIITSTGNISNQAGQIASNGYLTVVGQNLSNRSGVMQSGAGSALDVVVNGTLDNSHAGSIQSGAALNLQVNALTNSQQGQISA
ncbi:hypothetical protein, partial [Acinetobacter nosocomialis]